MIEGSASHMAATLNAPLGVERGPLVGYGLSWNPSKALWSHLEDFGAIQKAALL